VVVAGRVGVDEGELVGDGEKVGCGGVREGTIVGLAKAAVAGEFVGEAETCGVGILRLVGLGRQADSNTTHATSAAPQPWGTYRVDRWSACR